MSDANSIASEGTPNEVGELESFKETVSSMSESELKEMINRMRQEISSKERQLQSYFEEVRLHHKGLDEFKKKRDELNAMVSSIFEEANEFKKKRDELNAQIAEIKKKRDEMRSYVDKLSEKINRLKEIRKHYNELSKGKISILSQQYLKELDVFLNADIPLDHEINIHERLCSLAEKINNARIAEAAHLLISETYLEIKKHTPNFRALNNEIKKLSSDSQEYHLQMISLYDEARKVRKEADEYHARLKERYDLLKPIQKNIVATKRELQHQRDKIGIYLEHYTQYKREKESKKETEQLQRAKRKLDGKERLSLDDLKVLLESGRLNLK